MTEVMALYTVARIAIFLLREKGVATIEAIAQLRQLQQNFWLA